jgi:hypothetical protein
MEKIGKVIDDKLTILTVYIRFGAVSSVVASGYVFSSSRSGLAPCDD